MKVKKEEVAVNGKQQRKSKTDRGAFVLKCFLKLFIDCLGDAVSGEGKSLMEQLRGEALKFHKPGKGKK